MNNRDQKYISIQVLSGILWAGDIALLVFAGIVSVRITILVSEQPLQGPVMLACLAGTLVAAMSLSRQNAYSQEALRSLSTQLLRTVKPILFGEFALLACIFILYNGELPHRAWPFVWAGMATAFLGAARILLSGHLRRWTLAGRFARKVAVVGLGDFSHEFIQRLREESDTYEIVGIYDDRAARVPSNQLSVEVRGTVADLLECSRNGRIDVIVIALPLSAADRIKSILDQLSSSVADIVLTTDLAGLSFSRAQFAGIGRNPVVLVREAALKDWQALQKAVLDYSLGIAALLVFSPVLLVAALAIKLDSPGPIVFRQPRMGFNNRLFMCYKFRSMHHEMRDLLADQQTTRNDQRITRVGRLIRKLSIDELPQLFNVFNGTMSLVGPRPHAPNTKAADRLFTEVVQKYALRHRVKPGITGWAQVNGWRGETQTIDQIEQRVSCDLFYVENWSVSFDFRIILMTVLHEVRSRNAF